METRITSEELLKIASAIQLKVDANEENHEYQEAQNWRELKLKLFEVLKEHHYLKASQERGVE